jgi:glycosyltransferase involved in cell wall biosynthesis
MKVLHLINTLSVGGAELHLLTLCRFLRRQGVDVGVAFLREKVTDSRSLRKDFESEAIRLFDLRANSRYDSRYFGKLARVIKQERPDILHTHLPRADLAGAFARFVEPSLVWVCSVHGIYSAQWSGGWTLPLFRRLWRRADSMLCISTAVKDWLIQGGIPDARTRVIYYGIETEKFAQPGTDLRKTWGVDGAAIIGSIGRLEARKNHECLIAAMPEICKSVPNALLLIAGHDPLGYGKNLQRLIHQLGLKEKVRVIGFENDVASFLNAIDVFAFATKSEGFGQVLVEAMAAGKPVVASDIAPLTEIVVSGDTGILVERGNPRAFAEGLVALLRSTEKRRRMGDSGQQRVRQHFAAARMAEETRALYEDLLKERTRAEWRHAVSGLEGGLRQ